MRVWGMRGDDNHQLKRLPAMILLGALQAAT